MRISKRKYEQMLDSARKDGHGYGHKLGYQQALEEVKRKQESIKDARHAEEARLRTQSIDAIAHAITALARLIDGRDAR